MASKVKKFLGVSVVLLLIIFLGVVAWLWTLSSPLPQGQQGEEAELLARNMLAAINDDAWKNTGAIAWTFPRGHEHLWDRTRHYSRVRFDGVEVVMDLATKKGVAKDIKSGEVILGTHGKELVHKAWAFWANDSFWINPISKIRDLGTTRSVVKMEDGSKGLLVSYSLGGVTPGDVYLWILDDTGRPKAWRMWVSIIPIGGLEFSWSGWQELKTGVFISSLHEGLITLRMSNIRAASTLAELEPEDPFKVLD